ncbi:MAG TPA: hypothetical protein VEK83_11675 [Gemmatimonadales bacterium]|nr:hypothetical protein [Gemmatimonadales bacterium]
MPATVTIHAVGIIVKRLQRAPPSRVTTHTIYREAIMVRYNTIPLPPLLFALTLGACAASRTPVPLVGQSADISALAGEWSGDYSSAESGRSGSISFTLRAAGDSAFGDVVMVPAAWGRPLMPWREQNVAGAGANQPPASTVLTIRFVRVEHGHVSGTLDPYADPQTGARLLTRFSGELNGNTIAGTYTTQLPSGGEQTGRWSVQRR